MIYSGRKQVAAANAAEALVSTKTMASWLTCIALRDNTGIVYVGGVDETNHASAVIAGATTHVGHPLVQPSAATDGADFCNFREIGGPAYIDLSRVYVIADNAGDGVAFNYGRR